MNGQLLNTTPVPLPPSVRNLMRRALSDADFERFCAVQMFELSYTSEGLNIKGYLALPPAESSGSYPGLIFNRGGVGPRGALVAESAWVYAGLYASWGYVCVASNYRGQGGSEGLEEWGAGDVADAMHLIPFLHSLGYVDMSRLGLVGGSRGGMMAYMMLRMSNVFRAAITIGAPTILHRIDEHTYIRKTFAKYVQDHPNVDAELRKRSVAAWADELCKTTPLLLLHGSGDRRVAAEHSLQLALELQRTLQPYKLIIYDNADHVLAGQREQSNRDIRQWLDHYVRDAAPLPRVGPHGA